MALALVALGVAFTVAADALFPYDESADAHADLSRAMADARASGRLLMILFGANWCTDCRVLAKAMAMDPLAGEIDDRYAVAKVDVGNWDKHLDIAERFGNPIARGIPAMVVATPVGDVLYATRAGELATARYLGADRLRQFFDALPRPPTDEVAR